MIVDYGGRLRAAVLNVASSPMSKFGMSRVNFVEFQTSLTNA
jgi:hypothetical protein